MLVHSVFFWLKPDLTETQRAEFTRSLNALSQITSVSQTFIGSPAATGKRAVVDDSYTFALTLLFRDMAAHDAYQIDPLHKAFVSGCAPFWTKVQIYDAA